MSKNTSSSRVLIIGAKGTIGRAVVAELSAHHEIITAGRHDADVQMDIADPLSIAQGMAQAGKINAVICAAGSVNFKPLDQIQAADMNESAYGLGLVNKLLGQVNLALTAREYLCDGGSITLTAGILSQDPIAAGSSASMVNGALESFVRAAAIELPRGLRINAISPTVLAESMADYGDFFRGFEPVPVAKVARAYRKSVEGLQTGQVYWVV